jgi:hypothetical protein
MNAALGILYPLRLKRTSRRRLMIVMLQELQTEMPVDCSSNIPILRSQIWSNAIHAVTIVVSLCQQISILLLGRLGRNL